MDNQSQVPPVSTAETEKFWAGGTDARQAATGETNLPPDNRAILNWPADVNAHGLCRFCHAPIARNADRFWVHADGAGICADLSNFASPVSPEPLGVGDMSEPIYKAGSASLDDLKGIGIDMPGVGIVDLHPGARPICAGRDSAVDEVSLKADLVGGVEFDESPEELRERLFSQLIFAAKNLADAQIEPELGPDPAPFCLECMVDLVGAYQHAPSCRVGRVYKVLADLIDTLDSKPNPREEAADGESPAAGDGIRPHGDTRDESQPMAIDLLCLMCGERGGTWTRGGRREKGGPGMLLINRLPNQRIAEAADGSGTYVYLHCCEGGAR